MKAWISVVSEEDAQGELRDVYDWVRNARGSLSNVMQVHSLDPESIRLHIDLYLHLMFGESTLTRLERELIAVVVSHLNSCRYCVTHHEEALLAHAKDRGLLEDLGKLRLTKLSPRNRAMLRYIVKLTRHPGRLLESDMERLKGAGFSDQEILRVNLIASYFNFVNRVVSGLGVPLENKEARVYKH